MSMLKPIVAALVVGATALAPTVAQAAPTAPAARVAQELASVTDLTSTAAAVRTYPDAARDTDLAVVDHATTRTTLAVLRSAQAPRSFTVDLDLPAGATTARDQVGGVLVYDAAGSLTGRVSMPWAYDANGRSLPTTFTVADGKVTQHVDTTGAAFPVLADPHYTWGIITGTVYFNKNETKIIALGGTVVSWLNPALLWGGRAVSAWAGYAAATGRCVKVKFTPISYSVGSVGYYSGSSGDGYCR